MGDVIHMRGRENFAGTNASIQQLICNTGIPGYFTVAAEIICSSLFERKAPDKDFIIVVREPSEWKLRKPSLAACHNTAPEILWALGYMTYNFGCVISRGPVRFLHVPFRISKCNSQSHQAWRHLVVRQNKTGYSLETVECHAPIDENMQLGFVLKPGC